MDDTKLPLAVGAGTAVLFVMAAVSGLTGSDDSTPPAKAETAVETPVVAETAAAEVVTDMATAEVEASPTDAAVTADEEVAAAEVAEPQDGDTIASESYPSQIYDFAAMTPEQTLAFGAQVRAYLLDNPQVIMDAVAVLEQRQADEQAMADFNLVSDNAQALYEDGFSWVGGNPDGDVTIVEFMDYRCGYCRRAHPEVAELIASDGNIRIIVKELPILGEASVISSRFAIATQIVAGDDAYKLIYDALMGLDGEPSDVVLTRLANTLGLDADAIMAEMNSDEVNRRIASTRELAQAMQINGTPSFVMAGQMVRGYVPLDGMRQIVAEARASK